MQSLGSGFIIDPSGIIVTNNHVIDGADEISVTLQDNTTLKAKLVGRGRTDRHRGTEGDADQAAACGAFRRQRHCPRGATGCWRSATRSGLGGSVTAGIVSARGRDIRQGPYDDFIQTDAAINRGNSGGPLFDMSGNVIGINTAIYSPSGGSIGIGFSIPSNLAKNVVAQLRDYGHARRGWLGVRIQQVTPDIAESLGLHDDNGAMVAGVNSGGPADKAQIHNGDIILKFNNQDVKEMRNLPRIVAETAIGQSAPVVVWRDGHEQTLQAMVAEMPDDVQQVSATPTQEPPAPTNKPVALSGLGMSVLPITDDSRSKFQLGQDQKGVVITDIAQDGTAAQRGLHAGDVIVEVQQEEVGSPADVQDRIDRVRKQNRKSVLMLVQTHDGLHWVPLPLDASGAKQPG